MDFHGVVLLFLGRRDGAPVGGGARFPASVGHCPGISRIAGGDLVVEREVGGALHAVVAVVADVVAVGYL